MAEVSSAAGIPPGSASEPGGSASRLLVPTLVLLTCVTSVVSSLGAPLVPDIAIHYDVSLSAAQWTLTSTLVVGAVASPLLGRVGGNRRRRPVVLVGLGCVAAGLLLSVLPTGFVGLVAGRSLQGVGLALFPLVIAAAREALPRAQVRQALAMLSVASAGGAGVGYPLTSWVAGHFGLAPAFWLALGFTVLAWGLAARVLPSSKDSGPDRVDWWGTGLSTLGILGILLALTQGPRLGWLSAEIAALLLLTVASMTLWVRRSLRHDHPLVDLRRACQRATLPAHLTAFFAGVALYIMFALVIVSAQLPTSTGFGLGESAGVAGFLVVPYAVTTVMGSRLALLLGRWLRADHLLPLGVTAYLGAALGFVVAHDSVTVFLGVMAVLGIGSGLTFGALPGLIVRTTPTSETGSAIAFNQLLRFLGFSFGSTMATTCLELFSRGSQPDERGFQSSVLVACGIAAVTAVVSLMLSPHRASAPQPSINPVTQKEQ